MNKKTITVHCLVKNEENFIWYAIKSVVDFVDKVIIFDTGSADKTVEIIKDLIKEYPDKIIFEEKGECDKKRHTELRNEMIKKTKTDWFMILDGDEIWTRRGMEEALEIIDSNDKVECLIAPFYLCVGDVYHRYYKRGNFEMLGKRDFFSPRFIKRIKNVHWTGDYNQDTLVFADGNVVFRENNTVFLEKRYWHVTHLKRSSCDDGDYSSYGSRQEKLRKTYFLIGKKIREGVPSVMSGLPNMSFLKSFINFLKLLFV